MSLKDRFRIDELAGIGSKSIVRDNDGGITVRRIDKKEVKPILPTNSSSSILSRTTTTLPKMPGNEEFPQLPQLPTKIEPSQPKKTVPTTKADTLEPPKKENPQQESFSGETSTYIERPFYNEVELQKAVDLKVDELIKSKKVKSGNFIRKEKYDAEVSNVRNLNNQLGQSRQEISSLQGQIQSLQSQVQSAQSQVQSALQEVQSKDQTLQNLIGKYEQAVQDIQTAVIKGTKEAVERASLSAQVKGLQAQKETLAAQLKAQRGINENLQQQLLTTRASFEALLAEQRATAIAIQTQGAAVLENVQTQAQLDREASIQRQQQLAQQQRDADLRAGQLEQELRAAQEEARRAQQDDGGKIICNELYQQGFLRQELWDADERYGAMMFEIDPRGVIGYQMWARYVVKFMKKNPTYSKLAYWIFKPWTEYMGYEMGVVQKKNWKGYLTHIVGKQISYLVFDLNNGKRLLDLYNYKKFRASIG
jgi:hypothetical protein